MSQLLAHPKTQESLDAVVSDPRACYMLVGAARSGRLASALYVATKLHCGAQAGCTGCKRIMAGTDPDVLRVSPNEKGTITIEMAHNLVESLSKHPSRHGATRIVIIESAERMTIAAQNALLKVIEEPPAHTLFFVLLENAAAVLSTIASRCQTIYVRPLMVGQGSPEVTRLARGRAGFIMELASNPQLMESESELEAQAEALFRANTFERMVLVDKLATDKHKDQILDWLAYRVSVAARQQNGTSQALQSMQNYFIYSNAGVAGKHALMEMMIRL